MKKTLFKTLAIAIACVFGLNLLVAPNTFADDPICDNTKISEEIRAANGCPNLSTPKLEDTVTNILLGIIAIMGLVAVVFVIIGGVQYMTSTGDAGKVKKAKDTILYALIGLIVCVLSFAIVNWAIKSVIGGQRTSTPAVEEETEEGGGE